MNNKLLKVLLSVAVICLLSTSPPAASADSSPTSFAVDVPAGQWKTLRFKNLPKDAKIVFGIISDGPLNVGFLDTAGQKQFPRLSQPLFWGQVETKLAFSVSIQQKGDYYIIVDNRDGTAWRHVDLTTHATLSGAAAQAVITAQLKKVEMQLKTLEQKLNQTFVFEPVPIRVNNCNRQTPFERTENLTLCLEYAQQLMQTFQDKTQASDALVFSMFQEMARLFQSQWGLDASNPVGDLDELTTVLMLTFRLDANVRAYSQTIINQPVLSTLMADAFKDLNHPLTVDRAERVLKWATDPALVRNWQPQLVPHMQTTVLRHLKTHPQPWSDLGLIEAELSAREHAPPEDRPAFQSKGKINA